MNVTTAEVKDLGFRRIWKIVTNSTIDFFNDLRDLASLLSVCTIKPYSILTYWEQLKALPEEEVGGLRRLIKDIYPMVDMDEPDLSARRKFRNTWEGLWNKFGIACGLNQTDIQMLSLVGVRLPMLLSALENHDPVALKAVKFNADFYSIFGVTDRVEITSGFLYSNVPSLRHLCEFYNMVLAWYISVRNEVDTADLLGYLAITDFRSFKEYFKTGKRLWLTVEDLNVNTGQTLVSGLNFLRADDVKEGRQFNK